MIIEEKYRKLFFNKFSEGKDNECWEWQAAIDNTTGYGKALLSKNKVTTAHRISYAIYKGNIPKGLVVDHLCRNRKCVNPNHLEAVTHKVNTNRGISRFINLNKTHCPQGHEYNDKNTYIEKSPKGDRRHCRICNLFYTHRRRGKI